MTTCTCYDIVGAPLPRDSVTSPGNEFCIQRLTQEWKRGKGLCPLLLGTPSAFGSPVLDFYWHKPRNVLVCSVRSLGHSSLWAGLPRLPSNLASHRPPRPSRCLVGECRHLALLPGSSLHCISSWARTQPFLPRALASFQKTATTGWLSDAAAPPISEMTCPPGLSLEHNHRVPLAGHRVSPPGAHVPEPESLPPCLPWQSWHFSPNQSGQHWLRLWEPIVHPSAPAPGGGRGGSFGIRPISGECC